MALIPDVFPNLRTPKKLVRSMSKKSHFRGPFEKQGSKRTLTLLKFERQHLYHIYWSLWGQLSWKQSLLLICKILRLFVNTVTAVDKYSLLNRDKLTQPIQIQLSQKQKNSSNFLSRFLKSSLNFERFKKKDDPHCWRISIKKGLWNTWLDQCLKSLVSEDSSKRNMVNWLKHCWNLNDSTFIIIIDQFHENWLTKSLC